MVEIPPVLVVQYFHPRGGNFPPQYHVAKFDLQYSTSKGGKIHHPLEMVNLCTTYGISIASIIKVCKWLVHLQD